LTDKRPVLESIATKIFRDMNADRDKSQEDFVYKKEHLVRTVLKNTVTNILQRPKA